jgi:hypothetical protein
MFFTLRSCTKSDFALHVKGEEGTWMNLDVSVLQKYAGNGWSFENVVSSTSYIPDSEQMISGCDDKITRVW